MVEPDGWRAAVTAAKGAGYTWFELLTAQDDLGRSNNIIVTLLLRNASQGTTTLQVAVGRDNPELDRIDDLFAGAGWGQRYVHDFYGVRFRGADLSPLLNHDGGAPLRKDAVLGARAVTPNPSADPRRGVVAGVPDPKVWGDRDPSLPPPTAEELIAQPGRRRRR